MGDWRTPSGQGLTVALAVNAGSSSIKAGVYVPGGAGDPVPLLSVEIERIDTAPHLKARDADGNIIEDATWSRDGGGIGATIGRFADWIVAPIALFCFAFSVGTIIWFVPAPGLVVVCILAIVLGAYDFYLSAFDMHQKEVRRR